MLKTILLVCAIMVSVVGICYAAATSETLDTRAVPQTAYGTTESGATVAFLVDDDGVLQIS